MPRVETSTMSLTAVVADRPAIRPTSVADIPVSRP
jgi:hypothetical protein